MRLQRMNKSLNLRRGYGVYPRKLTLSDNSIHDGSGFGQVIFVLDMNGKLPMGDQIGFSGTDLRHSMSGKSTMRLGDLDGNLGLAKAELVVTQIGDGAWEVNPRLCAIILGPKGFSEVLALKSNCVRMNEKSRTYYYYLPLLNLIISPTELAEKEVV